MTVYLLMPKYCLLFAALICSISAVLAQDCDMPKHFKKKSMAIEYLEDSATFKKPFYSVIKIKAPSKGKDLKSVPLIDCNLPIPKPGKVEYIKILDVKNLPRGIMWSTNKVDNLFNRSETGCLILEGVPEERGIFELHIVAEGLGKYLMIPKTVFCNIWGYELFVN